MSSKKEMKKKFRRKVERLAEDFIDSNDFGNFTSADNAVLRFAQEVMGATSQDQQEDVNATVSDRRWLVRYVPGANDPTDADVKNGYKPLEEEIKAPTHRHAEVLFHRDHPGATITSLTEITTSAD